MAKYRKKPVVINAHPAGDIIARLTGSGNIYAMPKWVVDAVKGGIITVLGERKALRVNTLEGEHVVEFTDMLICGVQHELYGCKPDIFEATYDKVEE